MNYKEALDFIHGLPRFSPAAVADHTAFYDLVAMSDLMERLGNPQDDLKYVHIAGTNGKGSQTAFLGSILAESGMKVGMYTSPYLERFNERIRILDGEFPNAPGDTVVSWHLPHESRVFGADIPDEEVARIMTQIYGIYCQMKKEGVRTPSEFEILSAMAFVYFREQQCELVLMEVGLGGRLDATNIIRTPELAILCTISLDHTEVLGDTVEEIAAEKAGIIKEGGEVLCYPQSEGVMQVFEKACEACHGRMYEAAMPLRLVERSLYGQRFDLRIADEIAACCDRSDWVIRDLKITLPGTYQTKNAALAAQAACLLAAKGYPVTEESIRRGLRKTHWAGRFEWLDRSPDFIIDASHNLEGVEILKESLQRYFSDKPIVFIVGILRDKPYREMILPMLPLASEFYCVTIDSPRTLTAEELKQVIEEMGGQATACASVSDAVDRAELAAGSSGVVCAYGSLYYIGVVRGIVVGHRSSESK